MSFDALAWAAKVRTNKATDKLVLLGLAECAARDTAESYPSVAALCEFGSLNRKTVIASLDRLEAAFLIEPTGSFVGRTGQIKVYRLNINNGPKNGSVKESQKRDQSQKRNSPVFTRKESQKRDTEPVREPISQKTTSSSIERARANAASHIPENWQPEPLKPDSIAGQIVAAWQPGRLERELSKFRDFWTAASGQRARKRDWQAAWRTWIGNADDFGSRKPNTGTVAGLRGTRPDPALDLLRRGQAEEVLARHTEIDWGARPALPSLGNG